MRELTWHLFNIVLGWLNVVLGWLLIVVRVLGTIVPIIPGFRVLLAEDACAAMSPIDHKNALDYLDANFCHVKPTSEIIRLIE